MALADFTALVQQLARDGSGKLSETDIADAIGYAVVRYSQDYPVKAVADLPVVGGGIDLPEDWEADFSAPVGIEYPIGNRPPTLLHNFEWFIYNDGEALRILFVQVLGDGQTVRLEYTRTHVIDAETDTVPAKHREAVASWAAAILCDELATLFSANQDTTIQADSVDYTAPSRQFAARAKALRQRYFDELGINPKKSMPAGVDVSFPARNSLGGPLLTHGRL